jgi:hypothetical protein
MNKKMLPGISFYPKFTIIEFRSKKMRNNFSFLKILIVGTIVAGIMFTGFSIYAKNVSSVRHPNLAEAQTFIEKAVAKITDAQTANEFDMNGHAVKAKDLLNKAYDEIKLAAEAANK